MTAEDPVMSADSDASATALDEETLSGTRKSILCSPLRLHVSRYMQRALVIEMS